MNVYLAGKISSNDWRRSLVDPALLRLNVAQLPRDRNGFFDWPVLPAAVRGRDAYVGPFYVRFPDPTLPDRTCPCCGDPVRNGACQLGCDLCPWCGEQICHGSCPSLCRETKAEPSGDDTHNCVIDPPWYQKDAVSKDMVVRLCLEALRRADLVFAWVDSLDCYGTVTEIGYARALGKPVVCAGPRRFRDMWFVHEACAFFLESDTPVRAFDEAAWRCEHLRLAALARDDYPAYLRTDHWQKLRKAVLKRDGDRCSLCNAADGLHVHHRSYDRLGRESLDDLTTLCDRCHGTFHGSRSPASGGRKDAILRPANPER